MSQRRRSVPSSATAVNAGRARAQGGIGSELPHQLYMRMTCLEMERHRRSVERDAAMLRVQACDVRGREIDAELELLQAEIRRRRIASGMPVDDDVAADVETPRSRSRRRAETPTNSPPVDPGPMSFKY